MAIGATNFPDALDTLTELVRAVNAASTTIDTGGATSGATTINVVSAANAPSDGKALIVDAADPDVFEIVTFTGKTATTITGVTRNVESSGAKAWDAGDLVYFDGITALNHNVLASAIVAVQAKVRAGQDLLIAQASDYTGSNSSSAQKVFNASTNGAATLASDTAYLMRGAFHVHTTGTASHDFSILFAGTATLASLDYMAWMSYPASEISSLSLQGGWKIGATAFQMRGAINTATHDTVMIDGIVRCTTGGTFIPQFKYNAAPGAAPVTLRGSYLSLTPIGNAAVATIGPWT